MGSTVAILTKEDYAMLLELLAGTYVRFPTTRQISLTDEGGDWTTHDAWKLLPSDHGNIVAYTAGVCSAQSVYIWDDVLALENFRTTVVFNTGLSSFTVRYWDGVSSYTDLWVDVPTDIENARYVAYDILVHDGEVIVVGVSDSDFSN